MNNRTLETEKDFHDKMNILFCSTAHDFFKYFDDISNELFVYKKNLSIWYPSIDMKNGELVREDVYSTYFELFRLCVVPVTAELLDTDNAAKWEIKYALENGIPVLPLVQEEGLTERFNAFFGNIQYFDKKNNKSDETQLPYEEKLKLYLDRFIPTDNLVERVSASHKVRLFLSYRKKDRMYAGELLGAIHSNDGFKRVAVWYDEFLIAGDDYGNEISEAMKDSDAVLLLVTPGILEEDNYVMRVEYPEAVKLGKRIIPVEMYPVDRDVLREKYPGIGDVIEFGESEKILSVLGEIFDRERLSIDDPEDIFLLACAYLYGIDMEINYNMAEKLLTEACEKGCMDAYKVLIDSYFYGVGMEKYQKELQRLMHELDCSKPESIAILQKFVDSHNCFEPKGDKVIFWGEKYLELINEKYPDTKDEQILDNIAYVRDKIGRTRVIQDLRDITTGKKTIQKSENDIFSMPVPQVPTGAKTFREEKTSNEEAIISDFNYYKTAEEIIEKRYEEKGDPEDLKNLMEIYEHLGYAYHRFFGDEALAQEYFDKAEKLKDGIYDRYESFDACDEHKKA